MSKPYKSITYVTVESACPVDVIAIDTLVVMVAMFLAIGIAVFLSTWASFWADSLAGRKERNVNQQTERD